MRIGVVNTGSSSIKCSLFEGKFLTQVWEQKKEVATDIHSTLVALWKDSGKVDAIGHRVVHGGSRFIEPTVITPAVKKEIHRLAELAPLHNPLNLEGIEAMEEVFPGVPQIAVFDTAFHHTMSEVHFTYPIPESWRKLGIRRFGFHGISHQYCAKRAAELLKITRLNMISCHLGNGCSLAAIHNGKSVDTSMGFTPLEGMMMGTRSGSIDPGILFYLQEKRYDPKELDDALNFDSGLKGITGTADMRDILGRLSEPYVKLGYNMFILSLQKSILSLMASVNPINLIVFTGGIGENSSKVREDACAGLAFMGIHLDQELNTDEPGDRLISSDQSTIKVMVIHTKENKAIAEDVFLTI